MIPETRPDGHMIPFAFLSLVGFSGSPSVTPLRLRFTSLLHQPQSLHHFLFQVDLSDILDFTTKVTAEG